MTMPTVTLPDGTKIPPLGMGTWYMGESASRAAAEEAVLREGIELGLGLIDTAADLFYERGLPNVGINEVTERAGVAPGSPQSSSHRPISSPTHSSPSTAPGFSSRPTP